MPAVSSEQASALERDVDAKGDPQPEVLVARAEGSAGSFVADLLEGHGCSVSVASNFEVARSVLRAGERAIDFLVVDCPVGDENGLALVCECARQDVGARILALVEEQDVPRLSDCREIVRVIEKPLSPRALLAALEEPPARDSVHPSEKAAAGSGFEESTAQSVAPPPAST